MKSSSMEIPLQMLELNIILLGSTGSGKSASGNTIIGGERKPFKEGYSSQSETKICQSAQTEVDGRTITVFDTVGISDTLVKISDVQYEMEKMFTLLNLDVFLLVIRLGGKFTEEVVTAMKWIQDNFGAKVLKHTIVLFTHGDQFNDSIEDHLRECKALRSVVEGCSGGFHVFNNKDEARSQVTELLDKINKLRRKNGDERYTEWDYKETQDEILQRKYLTGAAVGGGIGGVLGGAAAGAIAAKTGAVTLPVWKAASIGAAVGAALTAAVVRAGVYLYVRKYTPRRKDKRH